MRYFQDLIKDLHGDTSGDFRDCLLGLFETPARYDAYAIKKSIYVSIQLCQITLYVIICHQYLV